MFSRFDRYVLSILVKYIIIVEVIITIVALFAAGASDFRRYESFSVTLKQLVIAELLALPIKISNTMPIAMVVASIVTVMLLMRSKEMLAYMSIGGRILRLIMPFVGMAVVIAASITFFEYKIYPHTKHLYNKYIAEVIKNEQYADLDKLIDLWMIDNNKRLIHVEMIDPIGKYVSNIIEYNINDNFQVESIRITDHAKYDSGKWLLYDVHSTDLLKLPPEVVVQDVVETDSILFDDLTSMSGKRRKELLPTELARMISVMKGHGLNAVNYEMVYYSLYANALSVIILVILVVPMGMDFSRRYSPLISSIKSFALGLAFWGIMAASNSFGFSGILSPLMANYLPHVLFLIIGGLILFWREKAR